jgi:hypothetical protein
VLIQGSAHCRRQVNIMNPLGQARQQICRAQTRASCSIQCVLTRPHVLQSPALAQQQLRLHSVKAGGVVLSSIMLVCRKASPVVIADTWHSDEQHVD